MEVNFFLLCKYDHKIVLLQKCDKFIFRDNSLKTFAFSSVDTLGFSKSIFHNKQ